MNGWDVNILQQVLDSPTCDSYNTNNGLFHLFSTFIFLLLIMILGNDVEQCAPVAQYVQSTPAGACTLNRKVPLTEVRLYY